MSSPYDHLRKVLSDNDFVIENPYSDLKQLLPFDMVTFACEIADRMVSYIVANVMLIMIFKILVVKCNY